MNQAAPSGLSVVAMLTDPTLLRPETVALRLGLAVGVGLLVGWQRQRSEKTAPGIRTFPLICLLGALTVLTGQIAAFMASAGFVALAALVLLNHFLQNRAGTIDLGITTEVATFVVYVAGVCLGLGLLQIGVAVGAGVAVLLHAKPQLHRWSAQIGEADFAAIMRFVLITLVILPVLPNRGLGPYNVLNPFRLWLLVVLIVGLSLAGYLLHKMLGPRSSLITTGLLGGFISSTATTVSYARQAQEGHVAVQDAAFVISASWTVLPVRLAILFLFVCEPLFSRMLPLLGALFATSALYSFVIWKHAPKQRTQAAAPANPTELTAAVSFAILFAIILVIGAAVRSRFGDRAFLIVGFVSGLADVDAIALSSAQLVIHSALSVVIAVRAVLLALAANTLLKFCSVWWLSSAQVGKKLIPLFLIQFAGPVLLAAFLS